VVVAAHTPFVRHGGKGVGTAIAIVILELRDFVAVGPVKPAIFVGEPQDLVLAGGEELIIHAGSRALCTGDRPDLTAAGAERKLAARE